MINRLLRSFTKKSENREYVQLLFGSLIEKMNDPSALIKECKQKNSLFPKAESLVSHLSTNTIYIEDYIDKTTEKVPEIQQKNVAIVNEEQDIEDIRVEDLILICDSFISSIIKKLLHMPLSMRYLCKLIEQLLLPYVKYLFILKNRLMKN